MIKIKTLSDYCVEMRTKHTTVVAYSDDNGVIVFNPYMSVDGHCKMIFICPLGEGELSNHLLWYTVGRLVTTRDPKVFSKVTSVSTLRHKEYYTLERIAFLDRAVNAYWKLKELDKEL